MTFPHSETNADSRRRLESLAGRLTDADLARSTSYGWTIAALLAHMAFWDQRVLVLVQRWKAEGPDSSPIDARAVNDSLKVICHALQPRAAIELCLSSAAAVDAELETLTPEWLEKIEKQMQAEPFQFRPDRSLHRNDHLKDIETLLQEA
jgi:hypothetical protein